MPLERSAIVIESINPQPTPTGNMDVDVDLAFLEGAGPPGAATGDPGNVPPMGGYSDFSDAIKQAVRQAYAQVLAAIAPSTWQTLTLNAGWDAGTDAPQYRREGFDLVRLRGTVKNGTGVIATLPVEFRPPQACTFVVSHGETSSVGTISIATTGAMTFTGNNASVQLDGIAFSRSVE